MRILDGTCELPGRIRAGGMAAVVALASLLFCSRREDSQAPRPAPRVSPAAMPKVPGVAKGGISFVAFPNADVRVFAAGTSEEVPLPGHTTPLYVSLAPGVYRIELTFPGARPAARNVTVEPGLSIAVHVEDPKTDVEELASLAQTASLPEASPASETRSVLRNGVRSFFRGDYDGCVKTLSRLSNAGDETARLFTAYALAGSVLAGGREATPELPRARALFESVPARARPKNPPGVSPRILEALAVPVGYSSSERSP